MAAQSAQIGVAEAALYPTIAVNGTIGWDAKDLTKLFESKSFFGAIIPSFSWNILNYGRVLNNVRLQTARTQELIAAYQSRVLEAAREVQIPLRGFLRSGNRPRTSPGASRPPGRPPNLECSSTAPASSISTGSSIWRPRRCSSKIGWPSPRATSLST